MEGHPVHSHPGTTWQAAVLAGASASAPLADFPALRKSPPRFPGVDLPGHFLKHADEQTVIGLEAVRRAVELFQLDTREQTAWGIIGAPRFMARMAGAHILTRFAASGGSSVPPHALAQNSLHSVSGAASIALGIHGPNVGLGGGPGAIYDGLTTALTWFDTAGCPSIWLILTQWDPEPIPDGQGLATNEPVCHAVALALKPAAAGESTLRLSADGSMPTGPRSPVPNVSEIAACLDRAHAGLPADWACQLPWGGRIELELAAAIQSQRRAA
jgi:hypothetical protein